MQLILQFQTDYSVKRLWDSASAWLWLQDSSRRALFDASDSLFGMKE